MRLTLSIVCKAAFDYEMEPIETGAIAAELDIVAKEFGYDEMNRPLRVRFGVLSASTRRARLARTRLQDFGKKVLFTHRKKAKEEQEKRKKEERIERKRREKKEEEKLKKIERKQKEKRKRRRKD